MLGRSISHYRIISQLGAGGMGVVYAAEDTRLGRPVALKFIPEEMARDRQALDRFLVEARAASGLNHSNICTVYDIGEDEGRPFIAMELMKGQTLRDRLAAGPIKVHQIVDIGIQVADALDAAHAQGIVHRDIKPANIFLTDRGPAKIMDFGLAKLAAANDANATTASVRSPDNLTVPGITLGTVAYMSPEQAAGEDLDGRTDLFSLGVVLYECATGHRPFTGNSTAAILTAILNRAPTAPALFNPDLPLRLQEVINNSLEKDREMRYQTAADLRADLKRVKRDLESGRSGAVSAGGESRTPRSGTGSRAPASAARAGATSAPARGRRGLIAAGLAVVALAVAGAVYFLLPRAATSTGPGDAEPVSTSRVRDQAAFAARSLEAKNYRSALSYAEEVLAVEPGHTDAKAIRDQARAMVDRFEAVMAEARRLLESGNARDAARQLDRARAIDPIGPGVAELSMRLADHFRTQAERPKQESLPPRSPVGRPTTAQTNVPAPAPPPPVIPPAPPVPPDDPPPAAQPQPANSAAPPAAKPEPAAAPAKPAPAAVERSEPPGLATPTAAEEESAIRQVVATYARALETRSLALYRSVKPNLTRAEEQRIEEGFRAVPSWQVSVTILSIDRQGQQASVRLRRVDTIIDRGRRQTTEHPQTLRLSRTEGKWVIVEIGQ